MEFVLRDFESELADRVAGLKSPDPRAWELWDAALERFSLEEREALVETYEYARSIGYQHEGLSPEVYFAHVLRVAAYAELVSGLGDSTAVKIGLLHNALEVGSIAFQEIAAKSSFQIASAVSLLRVDRSKQWDERYKEGYYRRLFEEPVAVRLVKVMDKVDNLFLLHLNPDIETKKRYRQELRDYVKPLALTVDRNIHVYLKDLMEFSEQQERR